MSIFVQPTAKRKISELKRDMESSEGVRLIRSLTLLNMTIRLTASATQ